MGGAPTRMSRLTPEHIVKALRQAGSGTPVADICCKMGVTEATY